MAKQPQHMSTSRRIILVLLIILLFIGLFLTLFNYKDKFIGEKEIRQEIQIFKETVMVYQEIAPADEENRADAQADLTYLTDLRQKMIGYNEEIFQNGQQDLVDAWSYQAKPFDLSEFGIADEVVGLVTIPTIDVEMPLYLGASNRNLLRGCAVLTETSMPVGGANTNCVIAAHRGWNEIPFVRDIEDVVIGDSIFVENFWETLEYRVSEIRIIYPNEYENILIQPDKDLLTIVTCHPYRVNSHRYLVICERYVPDDTQTSGEWVEQDKTSVMITASEGINFESSRVTIFLNSQLPWILLILSAVLLLILMILLIADSIGRKKKRQ